MSMPWWAMALGAPSALEKFVIDPIRQGYGAYREIRDDRNLQADREQLNSDLTAFHKAPETFAPDFVKYNNPSVALEAAAKVKGLRGEVLQERAAPVLQDFEQQYESLTGTPNGRFFADPESRQVLQESGLTVPDKKNPYVQKGLQDFADRGRQQQATFNLMTGRDLPDAVGQLPPAHLSALQKSADEYRADEELAKFGQAAAASGLDPVTFAIQNPEQVPYRQLQQSAHSVFNTMQTGVEKEADRRRKETDAEGGAGFQDAIAGLTGPSLSRPSRAQFANRGGYAPFDQVESDIRQAAADYNATPEAVRQAVDDARQSYKGTMLPMTTTKVGGKPVMGQSNLLGEFIKKGEDKSTTVVVNSGHSNKPPPAGYRHTPDGNLEAIPGGPAARTLPGKALPASAVDFFAETPMLISNLKEAQALAPSVSTGPLVGRMQNIASKVDWASDQFVDFQQKMATVENIMLKARSGAAVSAQEYTRFTRELPNVNDPPRKRDLKLKNSIRYAENLVAKKRREYTAAGYRTEASGADTNGAQGSITATMSGRSVRVNGKNYQRNADGTVTIGGQRYKVE